MKKNLTEKCQYICTHREYKNIYLVEKYRLMKSAIFNEDNVISVDIMISR